MRAILRLPPSSWPATQTARTWSQQLTGDFTTLASVAPDPLPEGNSGHQGIMAWSGGCSGTYNGHVGMFYFGGGDADYGGNEVYFLDLIDQRFYRITDPSTVSGGNTTEYGDGRPRPPHTYRHLVWTPGKLWLTSQAGPYPNVNTFRTVWYLDLSTLDWTQIDDLPTGGGVFGGMECGAVYSPTRDRIYVFSQYGEPWTINPNTLAVTKQDIPDFVAGSQSQNALEIWDSAGTIMYLSIDGRLSMIDIDEIDAGGSLSTGWTEVTVSGTFVPAGNYPGFFWHEATKRVWAWDQTSNRDKTYTLVPPDPDAAEYADTLGTWTAGTVDAHASNAVTPSSPVSTGTLRRFDLVTVNGTDIAVLLNAVSQEPYFYRLGLP